MAGLTGALIGGSLLGGLVSGGFGAAAAGEQNAANQFASEQMMGLLQEQMANMRNAGHTADTRLAAAGGEAQDEYARRLAEAMGFARSGTAQAATAVNQGAYQGRADLSQAEQEAYSRLLGGERRAGAALEAGAAGAEGALGQIAGLSRYGDLAAQGINPYDVTGYQSRLEQGLGQDPFANFQADPGYQFRQQQGEQAIQRAASAAGGRVSGRTLQELSNFNQGLASQEYGNFAQRQLAARGQELGAAGAVDQQRLGALLNQAGRSDTAALSQRAAQMGLAQTGYGAQGQIASLRAGLGQGLASLAQNSGQGGANLAMGLGQGLSNLAYGAGGQIGQLYGNQGSLLAGLGAQGAGGLANLIFGTGQARANAALGSAAGMGSMMPSFMQALGLGAQGAGQGLANVGNAINSSLSNIMFAGLMGGM
jgi:hypothetical protein